VKRAVVGAAAAALPLAGCSSASSATSATSAPTVLAGSPTAAAPSATPSGPALGPVSAAQQVLNDAVAKVGCSKFYLGSPPAPAVDLWGPCLLDEKSVTFYVVSTDSNEKNFLALLTNLGYSPKQIIKAPSLLAAVEDPTQVEQVRSALNGSLVG
jgi:hypothetical protein